jgi:hypothetical protein
VAAPKFPLTLLTDRYAVCRLEASASIPAWALRMTQPLSCVLRTGEELSVVCPEGDVPAGVERVERGFRAFKLEGPVPFSTTGVIAGLTVPLAAQGLSVFVLSTYDTDYLMVKDATLAKAQAALRAAGFLVR